MEISYLVAGVSGHSAWAVTAIVSVTIGVALFSSLQTYLDAYGQAARVPLVRIDAELG